MPTRSPSRPWRLDGRPSLGGQESVRGRGPRTTVEDAPQRPAVSARERATIDADVRPPLAGRSEATGEGLPERKVRRAHGTAEGMRVRTEAKYASASYSKNFGLGGPGDDDLDALAEKILGTGRGLDCAGPDRGVPFPNFSASASRIVISRTPSRSFPSTKRTATSPRSDRIPSAVP